MFLYIKAELTGSVPGVIIAQLMFAYGFSIVFFSAFWNAEIRALEDLVYTLGGTPVQAYRKVLIPVSMNALLICFFQTFLISWFQYGLTLLIGSGKVQTLPVKVYEYIGEANVYYAALASCLLIVPPALLLWFNKRFIFKPVGAE
jgi:putative spermidine/putrescine transport system permease protein